VRRGAGQQGCAFVDLVERVGADHQAIVAALDHGLGEGEQRLAGAVHRQHVARRVDPAGRHVEAALAPGANRLAQGRDAQGGGVHGHLVEVGAQRFGHEAGRAVLGLADGQGDGALARVGRDGAQQLAQFLERVGLQLVQSVVHECSSKCSGATARRPAAG